MIEKEISIKNNIENNIEKNKLEKNKIFDLKKEVEVDVGQHIDKKIIIDEHKSLSGTLKAEVAVWQDFWDDFLENVEDMFPELEDGDFDLCLDEFKKFRYLVWFSLDRQFVQSFLARVKLEKKRYEDIVEWKKLFVDYVRAALVGITMDSFAESIENEDFSLQAQMGYLIYIFEKQRDLEQEQRVLLARWFEEVMAYYKEWKILDVYEVFIDENWNIVIKWLLNGQKVKIIFDPKTKILLVCQVKAK